MVYRKNSGVTSHLVKSTLIINNSFEFISDYSFHKRVCWNVLLIFIRRIFFATRMMYFQLAFCLVSRIDGYNKRYKLYARRRRIFARLVWMKVFVILLPMRIIVFRLYVNEVCIRTKNHNRNSEKANLINLIE